MKMHMTSWALMLVFFTAGCDSNTESKGIAVNVVEVKQSDRLGVKVGDSHDEQARVYMVTVPASSDTFHVKISSTQSGAENKKERSSYIDCGEAPAPISDGNFIACENLNSQKSIEISTKGIERWTEKSVHVSWAAFAAGIFSIVLLGFTYRETRKTNEIARSDNRAWCDFIISKRVTYNDSSLENRFFFKVLNMGGSPAIKVKLDFFMTDKPENIPSMTPFASHFQDIIYQAPDPNFVGTRIKDLVEGELDNSQGRMSFPQPESQTYFVVRMIYIPSGTRIVSTVVRVYEMHYSSVNRIDFKEVPKMTSITDSKAVS